MPLNETDKRFFGSTEASLSHGVPMVRVVATLKGNRRDEQVQVSLHEHRGLLYIDVRVFFTEDGDAWSPTRKGIRLPIDKFVTLLALLQQVVKESGHEATEQATAENGMSTESMGARTLFEITDAYERHVILDMLKRTNWNQTEAAENFKIPLSTFNQKIKRLGIDVKHRREA
jgi:DNA-binding NtrC family response regulator